MYTDREKRIIFAMFFLYYFPTTLLITNINIPWTKETRSRINIAIPFVCTPVSEPLHAIRKNSNVFVSVA